MIKVITRNDSYIIKSDDLHSVVDNMLRNDGIYYFNDNVFVPKHEVVSLKLLKEKE